MWRCRLYWLPSLHSLSGNGSDRFEGPNPQGHDVICVDNLLTGTKDNIRHLMDRVV